MLYLRRLRGRRTQGAGRTTRSAPGPRSEPEGSHTDTASKFIYITCPWRVALQRQCSLSCRISADLADTPVRIQPARVEGESLGDLLPLRLICALYA